MTVPAPYARGELMNRILWRLQAQKPTSLVDVPNLEIGLAARPLPQAVRANPSFVPARTPRLIVHGGPGDGGADRTAGGARTSAPGDDPVGHAGLNPDVRHGLQVGLGIAAAIPGIGLIAGLVRTIVGLIPPGASPASAAPSTADNPEPGSGPTGSSQGITAEKLAAAQNALNDGIAAMAAGDTARAMNLLDKADQLAGGVLGLSADQIAANRAGAAAATAGMGVSGIDIAQFVASDSITQAQADQITGASPAAAGDPAAGATSTGGTGPGIDAFQSDPSAGSASSGADTGAVDTGGNLDTSGGGGGAGGQGGADVSGDGQSGGAGEGSQI